MIVLRKEQVATLSRERNQIKLPKLIAYLKETLPAICSEVDEKELKAFVETSISNAMKYDFEVEWDFYRFVYYDLLCGPSFDQQCRWAKTILDKKNLSATKKADRIELYYRNYLQSK